MIQELVHEISRDFHPVCAKEDDEIDDQEDRDVTLTEFFVKAPDKGSSYDYKFSCLFKRLSGGDCLQASDHS